MFSEIERHVLEAWDMWALPGPRPTRLSFIRRNSAWLDEAGKIVFYIFRREEQQPALIAKTVRNARHGNTIRREAHSAFQVWERLSRAMPGALPRPVALQEIAGLPVYFEQAVPGETLAERGWRNWTDRGRLRLLETALAGGLTWLSQFTRAMPAESCILDDQRLDALFLDPITRFRPQVARWPDGPDRLDRLAESVGEWKGHSFPLVAAHGDFWGGSLLYGAQGLCVIDWEFFQPTALPITDPLMLAVHPGFCVRPRNGGGLLDEFRTVLAEPRTASRVREQLIACFNLWGIPRAWYPSLLSLFLIERSLERDARLKNQGEGKWADLVRYLWEQET